MSLVTAAEELLSIAVRTSGSTTQPGQPAGDVRWLAVRRNRLVGISIILLILTLIAFRQSPRPDAYARPTALLALDWWRYPLEHDAYMRLPVVDADLRSVAVVPGHPNLVYAAGQNGFIVHSTDGGINWQRQTWNVAKAIEGKGAPHPGAVDWAKITEISFVDPDHGWMVDNLGDLISTTDGGSAWQSKWTGLVEANAADFVSPTQGWVVGYKSAAAGPIGVILATTDAGGTWKTQAEDRHSFTNVTFIDPERGWATDEDGAIWRTANGGTSWDHTNTPLHDPLLSIAFVDAKNGWVAGRDGEIYSTDDGGTSWEPQDIESETGTADETAPSDNGPPVPAVMGQLRSIAVAGEFGCAAGEHGIIVRTSDGGETWRVQSSPTDRNLESIAVSNSTTGWIVGDEGTILGTVDGGAHWFRQSRPRREHRRGQYAAFPAPWYYAACAVLLLAALRVPSTPPQEKTKEQSIADTAFPTALCSLAIPIRLASGRSRSEYPGTCKTRKRSRRSPSPSPETGGRVNPR